MSRRPPGLLAAIAGIGVAGALLVPGAAYAAGGGLEIIPDLTRLLTLLVLFVILVPMLNKLLFRPLLGVLEERARRIEGSRSRATELAQQAASLLARHDEAIRQARENAHAELTRVVEEARSRHQAVVGEARSSAEAEITGARAELARATENVRGALGAEAEPLAREIAARLLGRSAA